MFASMTREAFYIFGYPIMKYGITISVAILTSLTLLFFFAKKFNYTNKEALYDCVFWVIIGGIFGARLWYIILNWNFYINNPIEMLLINHGGMTIHGALIGGIIAGYIFIKKNNLIFLQTADLFALAIPIGQSIGRLGNFFNSEAFGYPTNLAWKLYIPASSRPIEYINYEFFHPTFLYEAILNIIIFFILYLIVFKKYKNDFGTTFFCYLIMYSIARIIVEYFRIDSVLNLWGLPVATVVSVFVILISCGFLYVNFKKS